MKKNELDWIVPGQTVTESRLAEAEKAGLPAGALAELWKGRTLNRAAVDKIKSVKVEETKPEPQKKDGE